jgi:hypothetical protein
MKTRCEGRPDTSFALPGYPTGMDWTVGQRMEPK